MDGRRKRNGAALAGYVALAGTTLALAEWLRQRGVPARLTRKLVHVTAGSSPLFILPIAADKWAGLLPYLLTIPMNLALWRSRTLRSLESSAQSPVIVYFAIAQSALIAALWKPQSTLSENADLFSGLMALTWGDALAALVGQTMGQHHYGAVGRQKSLEGSAAMFVTTATTTALLQRTTTNDPARLLARATLAASAATVAEGLTHEGRDNLAVPVAVVGALKALSDRLRGRRESYSGWDGKARSTHADRD